MTRRAPSWLVAALVVAAAGLVPAGCGADATLQRQQSEVLRRTCASLRERAGLDPAKQPPRGFMLDFVSKAPHDDGGPLTKDELAKRCDTSSPSKPQSGS